MSKNGTVDRGLPRYTDVLSELLAKALLELLFETLASLFRGFGKSFSRSQRSVQLFVAVDFFGGRFRRVAVFCLFVFVFLSQPHTGLLSPLDQRPGSRDGAAERINVN